MNTSVFVLLTFTQIISFKTSSLTSHHAAGGLVMAKSGGLELGDNVSKIDDFAATQFDPKFQVEGDVPTNHFCMDS